MEKNSAKESPERERERDEVIDTWLEAGGQAEGERDGKGGREGYIGGVVVVFWVRFCRCSGSEGQLCSRPRVSEAELTRM